MGSCLASLSDENLLLSSPGSCETFLNLRLTWEKHDILCVTTTFKLSFFSAAACQTLSHTVHFHIVYRTSCYMFLTSSTPPSVPQRWSMRWPAWTSHLLGRVAVSHRSAPWDSGPTSLPVCSNCPASQPCTRKCWAEVREKERLGAPTGESCYLCSMQTMIMSSQVYFYSPIEHVISQWASQIHNLT